MNWGWSEGILYVRKSEEGLRESENAAKKAKHDTAFLYGSISLLFHITFLLFFSFLRKLAART